MPFTLSHPAAVLPLRGLRLPVAAMAIGSMVPDLPLFVPAWSYSFSHSLIGVVTVDLAAGIVLAVVWWAVVRSPLVDVAPERIRERVPCAPPLTIGTMVISVPAVVAGALTHVGWDEFTHEGRWGERHVAWLATTHWGVGGVHWAQAVSSVVGLVAVMLVGIRALLRTPAVSRPVRVPDFAVPAVGAVAGVAAVAAGVAAATAGGDLHRAAFAAVTAGLPAAAGAALVAALVWWVVSRRARS